VYKKRDGMKKVHEFVLAFYKQPKQTMFSWREKFYVDKS